MPRRWLFAVIQVDQESFDVLSQAFNACSLHFKFIFLCHIFRECCGHMYAVTNIVETPYNTVKFCWSTHKRHSIARPKGRGMECLLWVQMATYCVDLSIIELYKILAIINRAIKGLHCSTLSDGDKQQKHCLKSHCMLVWKRCFLWRTACSVSVYVTMAPVISILCLFGINCSLIHDVQILIVVIKMSTIVCLHKHTRMTS